jgi:hypothetical protein
MESHALLEVKQKKAMVIFYFDRESAASGKTLT